MTHPKPNSVAALLRGLSQSNNGRSCWSGVHSRLKVPQQKTIEAWSLLKGLRLLPNFMPSSWETLDCDPVEHRQRVLLMATEASYQDLTRQTGSIGLKMLSLIKKNRLKSIFDLY
ncbi:hypothetical protein AMTRI_Chr05g67630 [Amborella trichopoda]